MSRFLEACVNCDQGRIRELISSGLIGEKQLNAKDKTGKTGLSHLCSNGLSGLVVALSTQRVDVNLADNEGNTPLIFAAQAGHSDTVRVLLHRFPEIKIDQANQQAFTPLIKAAIQGRHKTAKILLAAGANPYHRDDGRGLNALEWAEYCSRPQCVDTIVQYLTSARFTLDDYINKHRAYSEVPNFSHFHCRSRLAGRIRQSLPSSLSRSRQCSSIGSLITPADDLSPGPSPLQSLDDIVQVIASVVRVRGRSPCSSGRRKVSRRRSAQPRGVVPKVVITTYSKDDNYYVERPVLSKFKNFSNPIRKVSF